MSDLAAGPHPGRSSAWALDPPTIFLLAVVVLGFAAFTTPQFDPDFWWHARVGLDILAKGVPQHNNYTFTASTHPFITQEWGAEAIYALLFSNFGMIPVILLMAAATWVGFLLGMLRVSRENRSRWVLAVGAALVVISGLQIWGPRPQMFTFGLLGVLLTMLDSYRRRPRRGLLVWMVPLFIVWGSLHGGFVIGLGVIGVFLVGESLTVWLGQSGGIGWLRCRDLLIALVVAAGAPMVNPNGWGLYLYPLKLLLSPAAQSSLNEWQPPDFHAAANLPVLFLLVTTLLCAKWATRTRIADVLLAVAGLLLLLYAVRDIPIFAILVLPMWADGVQGFFAYVRDVKGWKPRRSVRPPPIWFVAMVLILVVLTAGARIADQLSRPENQLQGSAYPVQVGRVICDGPTSRVFAPYPLSGWLLYRIDHREPLGADCAPDRLFIFGEVDLMGSRVLTEYLDVANGASGSIGILRRNGVNLVWQPRGAPLVPLLERNGGWKCVFATSSNLLFAPSGSVSKWHAATGLCPS
jgi:hypothetical protein